MLDKLLTLFERLVLAQEAQAEAAKVLADSAGRAGVVIAGLEDALASDKIAEKPPAARLSTPGIVPPAPTWNPLVEQPMGRYSKEKTAVLDTVLAERGIDASKARTGQEKHTMLLEQERILTAIARPALGAVVPPAAATAPASSVAEPSVPAATPEKDAEPVTLAECQALSSRLHAAEHTVEEITAVWHKVNGNVKPKDTPAELLPAVKAALLAAFGGEGEPEAAGWE